jgi:DNA repair exonuclease SbcCD ATPase subunit
MPSPHARRRQRSLRLTVSSLLIVAALLIVGAAIAYGSVGYLAAAAVLGVFACALATRLVYAELVQSRVSAGQGRAELAREFLELTVTRTEENDDFQVAMIDRIRRREVAVVELEAALTAAQHRAAEATRKRNAETTRADSAEATARDASVRLEEVEEQAAEALVRVTELEQELVQVREELVTVRADLVLNRAELETAHAEVTAWQNAGPVRKRA